MKRIIGPVALSIAVMFVMVGCGGGGGGEDNPPITPPSQSIQGTYSLTGFQVNYSNGTTIDEHSSVITSWSGTMKLGTSSFSQSIVINNNPLAVSGSATISWLTPGVSGIAHVTDSSGIYDVAFSISGNDLSTYSGVVSSGGLTFEEWDYWTKVSDSLTPVSKGSVTENTDGSAYPGKYWIGELLTQ